MFCAVIVCAIAAWSGGVARAEPLAIISGPQPSPLEQYACAELESYLGRLTDQPVLVGGTEGVRIIVGTPESNALLGYFVPPLPQDLTEQEIVVRSGSCGGAPAVAVAGGSSVAVLWAAYRFLESLGVIFEFSGEALPPRRPQLDLSGLHIRQRPQIRERGLRLHLNFPMDQSAYSLPDFLTWVDRMARMKYNYVMFHFYSAHPWFSFEYRGARTHTGTFFVGSYMFGGRYDLPSELIGRGAIRNVRRFFPPEMEELGPGEELYRRTEERMRAVMDRCHQRGLRVAVSFEPLGLPAEIAAHLADWETEAGGADRLMRDLTVARLEACMAAYPQADEFQLISVEGSSDAPAGLDLKADLRRLSQRYGFPFDPGDETSFAGGKETGVHLTPYNDPATARELESGLYQPVVSTLRFVELALDVLADPRIADRMKREGKQGNVGIYLPHAQAVRLCTPALRAMMPAGSRLQMMVDYGARGTADQMPTWEALRGANLELGVITWLEFDGSMFLPQAWMRSVSDCVQNAGELSLTTLVANHWRVTGLEADAACLSERPWMEEEGGDRWVAPRYETWLASYCERLFGAAHATLAQEALGALEAATLYCRTYLFNVGFCWEGRWRGGYGYSPEHLEAARQLFETARAAFARLAEECQISHGRQRAEYLANRCQCAQYHLEAVRCLGVAEAAGRVGEAEQALAAAQAYMRTYSQIVADPGDEGMLVNYHYAVIRATESMARGLHSAAAVAQADPQKPVMEWSFDQGDERSIPDGSGNGFTAGCVGTVSFTEGRVGRALKLDGRSYLQVDAATAFNPRSLTFSAWVHPERVSARRGIMVKRVGNVAAPFVFGLADGALSFEGCGTGGGFWPFNFTGPQVPAGRWSHVAVTLEGGEQIVLYLDGRPVATKQIQEDPQPNSEPIVIGREAWGGEEGSGTAALFCGLLDEIKIWKRALAPAEVAAEAQ